MSRFDNVDQALRLLRRLNGRSQVEIAEAAGVTPAMLSNYEKGIKLPSLGTLGKILDGLGVSLQRLEEALDIVNERRPESAAAPSELQREAPATSAVPSFSLDGGRVFPDLELGLFEISRGFARALERSERSSR